jgi:hypothetical protein
MCLSSLPWVFQNRSDQIVDHLIRAVYAMIFPRIDSPLPIAQIFRLIHIVSSDDHRCSATPNCLINSHKLLLACGSRPLSVHPKNNFRIIDKCRSQPKIFAFVPRSVLEF